MTGVWEEERSAKRLLYDDAEPRLRRPLNPTVLRFRAPTALFAPVAVLISAAIPAFGVALIFEEAMGLSTEVTVGIAGSFIGVCLILALSFARREEKSFALLMPTLLSVTHALLFIAAVAGFVAVSGSSGGTIAELIARFPGPEVDGPGLVFAKAYIFLFATLTAASLVAAILFRLVGLRRVVAGA